MTSDEYPYLAQLSVPDRLRLAAYEARDRRVQAIHLRTIVNAVGWKDPSTLLRCYQQADQATMRRALETRVAK